MDVTVTKKPTSGLFVVSILISVAVFIFLIMPKFSAYTAAKEAEKAAKDQLAQIQSEQTELEQRYTELRNNKAEFVRTDLAIPDKADVSSIYALMEGFAKSANLSLTSVQAADDANLEEGERSPENTSVSPTLGTITVNMQVQGTVEGFTQLLASIEQSLRFIDVQSIDISQEKEQGSLTFRTVFKTYYQK